MRKIDEILGSAKRIAIAGHVNPDGDCVGSVMGLYVYLRENHPELMVDVYLENVPKDYDHMPYLDQVKHAVDKDCPQYDLVIILDASSPDRVGVLSDFTSPGRKTVVIDHHFTNTGYGDINHTNARASSACEVLFELLEEGGISYDCALCLYTGIVTDSGIFQYDTTSERTMQVAGILMSRGIPFTKIINKTFFLKTYEHAMLMSRTLSESRAFFDRKVLVGTISQKMLKEMGASEEDINGVVNQLKNIEGVWLGVLIHEKADGSLKVSLRSDDEFSAAQVASAFGGGGHIKAAGCTLYGTIDEVIDQIVHEVEKQL